MTSAFPPVELVAVNVDVVLETEPELHEAVPVAAPAELSLAWTTMAIDSTRTKTNPARARRRSKRPCEIPRLFRP
jgi:hypothetical protein